MSFSAEFVMRSFKLFLLCHVVWLAGGLLGRSNTASISGLGPELSFVGSLQPGTLRNNFQGWIGMKITVGPQPLVVTALGRWVVEGNSQAHALKLVRVQDQVDVPGGATSIVTEGATANAFRYGLLPVPITLASGQSYYLVTEEVVGGDLWHDLDSILSHRPEAALNGFVYYNETYPWIHIAQTNHSFGPVDFKFLEPALAPSVSLITPTNWQVVSAGGSVLLDAQTSRDVAQVTFYHNGAAVHIATTPPYSFPVVNLLQGNHAFAATLTDLRGAMATSGIVNVAVQGTNQPEPFLVHTIPGVLRTDVDGFVGMLITVGVNPMIVTSLARMVVAGNQEEHVVKIVELEFEADRFRVRRATELCSRTVPTLGQAAGQFHYVALPEPAVLRPLTAYAILSQERNGGDQWHQLDTQVTPQPAARVDAAIYHTSLGWGYGGETNHSFVPLNFLFVESKAAMASLITTRTSGGALRLFLEGPSGQSFIVEVSPNLSSWNAVGTYTLSGEPREIIDPGQNGSTMRFYRVRLDF